MKLVKFAITALGFGATLFAAFVFSWGWNTHIVPLSEIIPQMTTITAWALSISFRVLFKDISWNMLEASSEASKEDESMLLAKSFMVSVSRYGAVLLAWLLLWILTLF